MRAAVTIHKTMLWRIMKSPMSFFETTPIGKSLTDLAKTLTLLMRHCLL
ncbi:hypothetical protein B4U80_10389 [Leptotrombidium deliense]|uniref:ABC transmembrane type-1 domain-containing protein n=1 Tax=Leptotrombidium deliense TaxID=299467 RepID=A0A443RUP8_9ACAR|nr:hypothetical protein B4U80_10389 [Leptotrombidium deliense]